MVLSDNQVNSNGVKKLVQTVKKIADDIFTGEADVLAWFFAFSGAMAVRELMKSFLATSGLSTLEVVIDYIHEWLFFAITFLLIWLFLVIILKIEVAKLSKIFLWFSWAVIIPPLMDMLKTGGDIFWSFYLLGSPTELWREFISILGNFPPGIVYFGTKIMIILAVIIIGAIAYWQSKKALVGIISAVGAYVIFFFMAALPAFISFAYFYFAKGIIQVSAVDQIQLFSGITAIFGISFDGIKYSLAYNLNLLFFPLFISLLALFFLVSSKPKFTALVKNIRLPQAIGHIGFFTVGIGLGFLAYPDNFEISLFSVFAVLDLILAIILAWMASVIINDIYDFEVDKLSNAERPLPKGIFETKEYLNIGIIVFLLSLLGGLVVSPKFAALLFVYQFIAWAYSSEPFRLKNFPVIGTMLGAVDLILVMMIGFTLISGDNNIQGLSWRVILYLLIFLTFFLPIKDFKDIEADKKYHTWTLPVIFGEETGRMLLAIWAFVSFVASVFFLNEYKLFWWAILFGSIMFFILVNKKTKSSTNSSEFSAWVKPRHFFWWALVIIGGYGLVMVKTLFL